MFKRSAPYLEMLIVVVWVGSLWTMGYMVAPTLFATLSDRALAGNIAGSLFRVQAWISLVCALILLVVWILDPRPASRHPKIKWLTVGMAACTLIGYFGLQPMMAALKSHAVGGVMTAEMVPQFAILHGAASLIYLVQSVLGIWLLFKIVKPTCH